MGTEMLQRKRPDARETASALRRRRATPCGNRLVEARMDLLDKG
jgi:hypothetical protein